MWMLGSMRFGLSHGRLLPIPLTLSMFRTGRTRFMMHARMIWWKMRSKRELQALCLNKISGIGADDSVEVTILHVANQFIDGRVHSKVDGVWIHFTVVYASPYVSKRKLLWQCVETLNPGDTIP
ncbi:hypothetical protein V6N11_067613 [Hibiscus sabdariffa]|uniref:Uncharacterized protein n=1 Tax=Hibiscus sabdariffa TaxID=183260 RepID=A0ABR2SRC5_9ROSI